MNNQQIVAIKMALDALERPNKISGYKNHLKEITALREVLAQPQGEWVDLTVDEIAKALNTADSHNTIDSYRAVIAKFKEKNTPSVAPQGEHKTDGTPCWCNPEVTYENPETGAKVLVHQDVDDNQDLTIAYMRGFSYAKEKAAKVCESFKTGDQYIDDEWADMCAAAIRSMK